MKTDRLYIDQILDSIRKIELYTSDIDKEKFMSNQMAQSAVILQLMLIGEISKRISNEAKSDINLPWKEITGFRDVAIHDYFDVDLDVVWNTVTMDLPVMKEQFQKFAKNPTA